MPCNAHNHPASCECGWGGVWYGNVPYTPLNHTELKKIGRSRFGRGAKKSRNRCAFSKIVATDVLPQFRRSCRWPDLTAGSRTRSLSGNTDFHPYPFIAALSRFASPPLSSRAIARA